MTNIITTHSRLLYYTTSCRSLPMIRSFYHHHNHKMNQRIMAFRSLITSSKPLFAMKTFKLADIGEGIHEVELLKWHTRIGDSIQEMDNVCEIQSDKSAVEISSPYAGKIIKLHHRIGDIIKIGSPLLDLDVQGSSEASSSTTELKKSHDDEVIENPTIFKENNESQEKEEEINQQIPFQSTTTTADHNNTSSQVKDTSTTTKSILASPASRALAKELNVDMSQVSGTGPKNRILKEDVLKFKGDKNSTLKKTPISKTDDIIDMEEILLTSAFEKGMVKAMKASLEVPYMSVQEDIDMFELMRMKEEINRYLTSINPYNKKLTLTPIVVKAISQALKQVPILNSKFNITTQDRYTLYSNHNVSIAIATPHGLVVPNIKNVQTLNLMDIQEQLTTLQDLAMKGKLMPNNLIGGTISLSNLGAIGGTAVRPILFDGQAAILGLGRLQKSVHYDPSAPQSIILKDIMNITASVDHRHVDGAAVARFMAWLKRYLEVPGLMLL